MLKAIREILSDGKTLSWLRVAGSIALPVLLVGWLWSVIVAYDTGVLWSSSLIAGLLGFKVLQKKIEK